MEWIIWAIQPSLENDKNSRVFTVCKNTEISIVEVKLNRIGKGLVRPGDWIPLAKLGKFTSLDLTRRIAFNNEKHFDCLFLFLFLLILHHIFSLFIIKS